MIEEYIFQEVEQLRKLEEERTGRADKDITEESEEEENKRNKHTIRYLSLKDEEKHLANLLLPGSTIFTRGTAKLVWCVHEARATHPQIHYQQRLALVLLQEERRHLVQHVLDAYAVSTTAAEIEAS